MEGSWPSPARELCRTPRWCEEHDIVCENLEEDFGLLVGPLDGANRGSEPALVAAERALDLRPLAIDPLGPTPARLLAEPRNHLSAILSDRPLAAPAPVQRDHRGPDSQ